MSDLSALIDAQIDHQGVSVIRVSDGHVLTFTRETLERLLTAAQAKGKVILFVKHGVAS